jgi:hypothetical protein
MAAKLRDLTKEDGSFYASHWIGGKPTDSDSSDPGLVSAMHRSLGMSDLLRAVRDPVLQPGVLLARGVARAFNALGCVTLTEVTLANGRRADLMVIDAKGDILIVEVKSSIEDFRADRKWAEYREFCDAFYFAIPDHFPSDLIPIECGLIVADSFQAEILRVAPVVRLVPARRKALTLRFAQLAAQRLYRLTDPGSGL